MYSRGKEKVVFVVRGSNVYARKGKVGFVGVGRNVYLGGGSVWG